MNRMYETLLCVIALGLMVSGAAAQDAGATASASAPATASATAPTSAPAEEPLYPREGPWGAEGGTAEFGMFWGLFFPSSKHELYEVSSGFKELENVTPALGLRAAYFPWRPLGVELELGMLPTQTKDTNQGANIFAARAHAILQAPTRTLVPFLLIGGGVLAETSEKDVLGKDTDPELHVGVGVKGYATSKVAVRFDVRDNFSRGYGKDEVAQHWEALIGMSLTVGRNEPPPPPPPAPDTDADGVADDKDKCPSVIGIELDGCPPDADGDMVPDTTDVCPNEPGFGSKDATKNGCPPPLSDCDHDGVPDQADKCPDLAGDGPDGCILDTDADGVRDTEDKCAQEAETKNSFEDSDGCPDEISEAVKQLSGVLAGVEFDAKATLKPSSSAALDGVVKTLTENPTVRVQISAHTDNANPATSQKLSTDRAAAVKAYLVSKGVSEGRLEAVGAGDTAPIGDNATKEGRAQNRRIELKVLP